MTLDYKKSSLTKIIKKIKENDRQALKELIKREQTNIYATLRYLGVNQDEILDLVQDILLKITNNIQNLKNIATYKSWSNKIILRQFYDYLRKNKKIKDNIKIIKDEEENTKKKEEIPDHSSNPIKNILSNELDEIIKNAINNLPNQYKIAIVMRELQGLTYDQIAKATKTNVGTVKSRIARAREKLQEEIKHYIH
ncbi:MAG: sigma-70 family RNA polymerase sigma factor [Cyanobacteria bacterium SIG30]|nr:sigma-70 family RNA polymerase sigma factor [Cyanobacteria bacterium SIG30]